MPGQSLDHKLRCQVSTLFRKNPLPANFGKTKKAQYPPTWRLCQFPRPSPGGVGCSQESQTDALKWLEGASELTLAAHALGSARPGLHCWAWSPLYSRTRAWLGDAVPPGFSFHTVGTGWVQSLEWVFMPMALCLGLGEVAWLILPGTGPMSALHSGL